MQKETPKTNIAAYLPLTEPTETGHEFNTRRYGVLRRRDMPGPLPYLVQVE